MGSSEGIRFIFATTKTAVSFFEDGSDQADGIETTVLDFSRQEHLRAIEQLCKNWEQLRQSQGQITRFNSPIAFQRRAIAANPTERQPFACALEVAGEIVVVAVGRTHTRPMSENFADCKLPFIDLRTLQLGESSVIHNGGKQYLKLLFDRLAALMQQGNFDLLECCDLIKGSEWHRQVDNRQQFITGANQRENVRWQTQVLDPASHEPLQHHSSKTRKNIRQRDKKLTRAFDGDVVLEEITQADQIEQFVTEAGAIVSQGYQAALNIGIRANDLAQKAYLYELAAEKTLRAYVLRVKGEAIAYAQGDLQRQTLYLWSTSYLPAYREYAPGIVLMHRIIGVMVEEGIEVLDFGCGDSTYKQRFGSRKLDILHIRLCAPRFHPALVCRVDRARAAFSGVLRRWMNNHDNVNQFRTILRRLRNTRHKLHLPKKDARK